MHGERDVLVKKVFPEIRRRCRERGVEFVEVDLRWGITEAQAERGEVLPICLAEIERCRPYFIGLLGERYGWVPPAITEELVELQPWLREHTARSLTELEILHGVLKNPEAAQRAFFYFRDPTFIQTLPVERRGDFTAENPESAEKLHRLKERIRGCSFSIHESYPNPEALGELVLQHLWQAIDQEFPQGTEPAPLDREATEHEAFAESRRKVYIGRQEDLARLNAHIASQDQPLVLLGESGSGKSALIANWVRRYREANPSEFVLLHFIGSTRQSADYTAILSRIIGEIKRRYDVPNDIPAMPEKLKEEFPQWLAIASANGGCVMVLDALNQLEDRDNALDLGWLPAYFPPNVRVILSTLQGRSREALSRRPWPTFQVKGLSEIAERKGLIRKYLELYSRKLSDARIDRIVTQDQTANPLYLRTLLEELRVFGIYEELDRRIDHYLQAQTIPELYDKVLARLEDDYENERPDLVREVTTLLWAARRGLSETELLELLKIPRSVWSPLYLAMEESLTNRSGLLGFFHDFLRQAVEHRYLRTHQLKQATHLRLADYFDRQEISDRKVDEYPYQLSEAKEWERLKESLTEPGMFQKLMMEVKQYELIRYWHKLGDHYDIVGAYQDSLRHYEASESSKEILAYTYNQVAFFLDLIAKYNGADLLYRKALAIREQVLGPDHPSTALSLNNLASLLQNMGDYKGAEPLYRRSLAIREQILGEEHPDTAASLNKLAFLLQDMGDYRAAEPLYRRALAIRERALGEGHPDVAISLYTLAFLLLTKGDYQGAEPLYRRALAIRERALGSNHPKTATCLNDLALLFQRKGDYARAEPLYQRALAIREQVLGVEHPSTATTLNNLGFLLQNKGDYKGAEPLLRRALAISERVRGPEHPHTATILDNLGILLQHKGDNTEAEHLCRKALAIPGASSRRGTSGRSPK